MNLKKKKNLVDEIKEIVKREGSVFYAIMYLACVGKRGLSKQFLYPFVQFF